MAGQEKRDNPIDIEGTKTYDINQSPFRLYGLCRGEGQSDFRRLPVSVAEETGSETVKSLYRHTAGIRLRFRTNSERISLRASLPKTETYHNLALTGSASFDLYSDGDYLFCFNPDAAAAAKSAASGEGLTFVSSFGFQDRKMREITIHFPLYNEVSRVDIALDADADVMECEEYEHPLPVVYYGSSITQGGCASHPGNSYEAIISRNLGTDYINLGFSGGCRGEICLADYIASLPCSAFVLDYDHNAPDPGHLEKTHSVFYSRVRERRPDLPIILISAADDSFGGSKKERRDIIFRTYEDAKKAGDGNIYFIDGEEIYPKETKALCTVDRCHPNDLGFYYMAEKIGAVLKGVI